MKLTPTLLSQWHPGKLQDITDLNLKSKDISHIDDISVCVSLKRMDLTENRLMHADALSGLRYCKAISWLNVSKNGLQEMDFVEWLTRLQVLNLSGNELKVVPRKIQECKGLKALVLSHNKIKNVENISGFKELNTLIISDNLIESLPTFASLISMRKLGVTHNKLRAVPQLAVPTLNELRLNDNKITKLEASSFPSGLRVLDLGNNLISSWTDVEALKNLILLDNLNLKGNPICKSEGYSEKMKEMFPNVRVLDGTRVDPRYHERKRKRMADAKKFEGSASKSTKNTRSGADDVDMEDASVKGRKGASEAVMDVPYRSKGNALLRDKAKVLATKSFKGQGKGFQRDLTKFKQKPVDKSWRKSAVKAKADAAHTVHDEKIDRKGPREVDFDML